MPGSELARTHVPSRSTMIKTAESVHFVYDIPYSGICGLVGTYLTIFDEQRSCLRPIAGATTSTRERIMSKNAARGSV
jgi:hypothetical protein